MDNVRNSEEIKGDDSIPCVLGPAMESGIMFAVMITIDMFLGMAIITGLVSTTSLFDKILWVTVFALSSGLTAFLGVLMIFLAPRLNSGVENR